MIPLNPEVVLRGHCRKSKSQDLSGSSLLEHCLVHTGPGFALSTVKAGGGSALYCQHFRSWGFVEVGKQGLGYVTQTSPELLDLAILLH